MLKLKPNPHQVMNKLTNCDNHVVANSISKELVQFLQASGFSEKNVTGGDPRVRMKHLWSKKSSTLEDGDEWFKQCQFYIEQDKSFVGYIEEEIITIDEPVPSLPWDEDAWDSMLPQLSPSPCPEGIYKACDIHLALHDINPKVEQKLLEAGFYYLELDKPHLSKVRIYTMQTQDLKIGREIFQNLKKTLEKGGGVEGFLKFEATRNLYNQDFALPPLILS